MASDFMSTAQKILNLLNREPRTVSELAAELGISRNSTHVQVVGLEAAGALEKIPRRAEGRVGKPAFEYRTVARHEDAFSSAYKPLLGGLAEAIGACLSDEESGRLLRDAGRCVARASDLSPTSDFDADLQRALDAVNALGAMAERSDEGGVPGVSCHTCPMATLVHRDPGMCTLVASFFAEATATAVTVQCRRDRTVVCGFSFGERAEGALAPRPSADGGGRGRGLREGSGLGAPQREGRAAGSDGVEALQLDEEVEEP